MSKKLYEESNIQAIANAIREKNNTQNQYTPSQMPNAILQIHGEPDLETLTVTENGNYLPSANKDGFSEVAVNVPNSYTNSDEGKVVKNGSLISQTPRSAGITENGTYDTTENNSVVVNVPTGSAVVQSLSVTRNGTYNPPSGVDGYAPVTVNVPSGGGGTTNILSGTTEPTSVDGSDGDIYLYYVSNTNLVTNVRMVIHGVRGTNQDVQLSEIQLLDSNGDVIPWDSGIATTNGIVYASNQAAEKAFDNIANQAVNKWYTSSKPSLSNPIWIDFEPSTPIVYSDIDAWQWWTANDTINRDPTNFSLQVSFDWGHTYYTVDEASGASITTNRNTLAYTHTIGAIDNYIMNAYCKVNGTWQNLIGTVIDDVNVGNNNV